ncbi:LysR family transcriptional regulator, regulator for metE and metH [Myxococcus fulvus]|uniref:LysR family transcriptional regulator n=1 Tax=Myxococcus fulvus TaxID=33 RepID=A0A511TCV7_MYXFU|nr:LysR family transcriptional regulator [Myxococcus fulvus]GEN11443.1 LysR family transcriptional regulator [Myxococcus fulvus]SEU13488.1 LysR family transcriptional regulator, regulator for metE and metH [Myxococcus fulvus]
MDDIAPPPSTRLDIKDLRVVMALASAGTTAQAASLLHLTQPAVSRALLSAEDKLEATLFDRTPRGLVLTEAGRRLVAGAGKLLVELGELEREVRTPATPPVRLRLVCECYTAYHWLPSLLVELRRSIPRLTVDLAVEHTQSPLPAIEAGDIDVALLTHSPLRRSSTFEVRPLFQDELVFVVSPSHPLAARKTFTAEDLKAHPLLTSHTPKTQDVWFVNQVFGRERPRLRVERIPLTEALLDLARAGLGVAVMSEWIIAPHLSRGDLVLRRLDTGPLERPWRIAWRKEAGDAAARLGKALLGLAPQRVAELDVSLQRG